MDMNWTRGIWTDLTTLILTLIHPPASQPPPPFKKKQHLLISSVDINCLGSFFHASFGHFYMITQLLKFKLCIFPISTSIFFQPDSKQNANTQALAIISSSS